MSRRQAGPRPWGRCLEARPCRRLRCCRGSGRRCRGWWSAGRRQRSQNYRWSPQMATMPNPCVGVCVSVSRVPTGTMEGWRLPANHRGGMAAAPSSVLPAAWKRTGTREEPGTLTQGGALFSLVPLVWESNPKLQGGWCKTQPPAHRGIWSQPSGDLEPTKGGAGTREEPGTLTQGAPVLPGLTPSGI